MILVLGSVTTSAAQFHQALALSHAHVRRARTVPGCLSHAVHIDGENPHRLVFVEQWQDQDSIWAHVKSAETRAFVKALSGLATAASPTAFFDAHTIRRPPRESGPLKA